MERLELFRKKQNVGGKIDIRPRNAVLQSLEGWYKTEVVLPAELQYWYDKYQESGSRLKITTWLSRNSTISANAISQFGKLLVCPSFKVSCRYNDLLRLGDTHHYLSCMEINRNKQKPKQQIQYLADPDIALCFIADSAGKFVWRSILRFVHTQNGANAVVMHRRYGNGPSNSVVRELGKYITVFAAVDIRTMPPDDMIWLQSPTRHNNKAILRPIWTDHRLKPTKESRISIAVYKEPLAEPNKEYVFNEQHF